MSQLSTKAGILEGAISYDESAELIGESVVEKKFDLGHSLLYRLKHPSLGHLAVLNSSLGDCALMFL